jgi:hypothetical protein
LGIVGLFSACKENRQIKKESLACGIIHVRIGYVPPYNGTFICYLQLLDGMRFQVRNLVVRLPINRSNSVIAISDRDLRYCRINSNMVDLVTEVSGSSRNAVGNLIKTH